MGQREDHDVVVGEDVRGGLREDAVHQGVQVRLKGAEALPRVGVGRDGSDGDERVAGEQAQGLSPGVAAGSGDGDGVGHGPILA